MAKQAKQATPKPPPTVGRHWPEAGLEQYGGADVVGPILDAMEWHAIPAVGVPAPVFSQAWRMGGWSRRMATSGALAPVELFAVECFKSFGPVRCYLARRPDHYQASLIAFDVLPYGAADEADPGAPLELEAAAPPAPVDPIGTATYNVCDDKLRFSADRRLTDEEYKGIKAAGFAYWHGSKLFVSKWGPGAEDYLTQRMGVEEIEADNQPDDVESRVDRFAKYKGGAERAAEAAENYVHRIADGIPMGRPILVGHHSERHARADAKRIDNGMRRAIAEGERAAYWRGRISGAIRHAARKENPGVIARRIKGLETDERRAAKNMEPAEILSAVLHHASDYRDGVTTYDLRRGLATWRATFEHNRRWREHVAMRLEYERALIESVGGLPDTGKRWEIGGAVRFGRGEWCEILKVNKVTFQCARKYGSHIKYQKSEAGALMTRAQFEAYKRGEFDPDAPASEVAPEAAPAVELEAEAAERAAAAEPACVKCGVVPAVNTIDGAPMCCDCADLGRRP